MQEENKKILVKALSFGCRLNALETEKIQAFLLDQQIPAILVNSCAVTAEAERQAGQTVRKLAREYPLVPIFVTGCAATRNPALFLSIPNVLTIPNYDKLNITAYIQALKTYPCNTINPNILENFNVHTQKLSKQFIQVQNGCNHNCAYCVTKLLRGPAVSFEYKTILSEAKKAVQNGFYEIVLTGVDTASYAIKQEGKPFLLSDLCKKLLSDVPEIKRLRLSSLDPASPEVLKIIDLIKHDKRMMPHIHLSMQSGSDTILEAMHRRHSAETVRKLVNYADGKVSFGWDIICGFPGETEELFQETLNLAKELKPIRIHAFPFSPRPDTEAATLPNQVNKSISKKRVKIISEIASDNYNQFAQSLVGKIAQVLVEENNMARTPDDLPVKITGKPIPSKTICDVFLSKLQEDTFIAEKM